MVMQRLLKASVVTLVALFFSCVSGTGESVCESDAGPAESTVMEGAVCSNGPYPKNSCFTCSGQTKTNTASTLRASFRDVATDCFQSSWGGLFVRDYVANSQAEAQGCASTEVSGCGLEPYFGAMQYFCFREGTTTWQELSDSQAHATRCVAFKTNGAAVPVGCGG